MILNLSPVLARAQGTAFAYNGKLDDGTNPANGSYDITFTLFATNNGGDAIAGPVTNSATDVTNGIFSAIVDFGTGIFTGSNYWMELDVRTSGGGNFVTLSPRQPILPTPYAVYSTTAGSALTAMVAGSADTVPASNITGTIPLAKLPAGLVTNNSGNLTLGSSNEIASLTVAPTLPAAGAGLVGTGLSPYDLAVAGRYAYVVNYDGNSLQVVDVSQPAAPAVVGSVRTQGGSKSVAVAGRYAYVANYGDNAHSLQVFDVSDPSAPVSVGSVPAGYVWAVVVSGRYAYLTGSQAVQIIDVGNPAAPVQVGSAGSGGGSALAIAGRYAYVVNFNGPDTLQIFDVSNPAAPVQVGSATTTSYPSSVAVSGRYAYVMSDSPGGVETLQVFDVSNPAAPVNVSATTIGNGWSFSLSVAGRYVYVANYSTASLGLIDVSDPLHPHIVGSAATGNNPNAVVVSGRFAYVVNYGDSTLETLDFGGAYIQQLEAGAIETGTLQTRDTLTVGNNLDVRSGLTVSGSAQIDGGLSVNNGTIAAANFSGNGSGLTNVPAGAITGGITTNITIGVQTLYFVNGLLINVQ
jgi:hypothetical protein